MKLKDTLYMPSSEFKMKANLTNRELNWQKEWQELDIYNKLMEKNEGKPLFILHDGPPYANGDLHIGHALNKILKDFVIRQKNMSGYKAPMIMGWDTHGLPIENALLKKGKIKRNEISDAQFRQECENYAIGQVEKQKEQFFSLGILASENENYLTLDKEYESEQIKVFAKMVKENIIYKGLKPVYWSPSSQSALAEAEIEYQDKMSPAIYVGMDLINNEEFKDTQIVIWTTTPWTLPANLGVAVGEEITYSKLSNGTINYIVATDLVENFLEKTELEGFEEVKKYDGSTLEGIEIQHPFIDRVNKVMIGHHVTVESGTGCVHIAPGHGEDDFIIGKKYGLEVISVVNAKGMMNQEAGEFSGEFYEDANKLIGEKIEESGHLIHLSFLKHSYPHDWRTKKPVMFRATAQWFATLKDVKHGILEELNKVKYPNEWSKQRISNMIDGRDEWCISRQRKWGVPIPIFYTEDENPILDYDLIIHVANLFEQHGSNIWYEKEAKDLLPEGYSNPNSPNGEFTKEMDIMDVWFDSGSSHTAVIKKRLNTYPADLYLEGSDQYRGWFNSSLITGYVSEKKSPYKQLISHGFVLDGKGNKMSKSLGNVITPKKITSTRGADILRLWVSQVDYQSDVRVSEDIIDQVSEIYRRYRNTIKFMLGAVNDLDKSKVLSYDQLSEVDQFMMQKLNDLINRVNSYYDHQEFKKVVDLINNYITYELSAFYLDFIKDIIYIEDSKRSLEVKSTIYYQVDSLIKLMAPILAHTTYEAFDVLNKGKIIALEDMPKLEIPTNDDLVKKYEMFLTFRSDVNRAMEEKRNEKLIGKTFEAKLIINPTDEMKKILENILDLETLFIVSKLEITDNKITGLDSEYGTILVEKYEGHECERCRKYFKVDEVVQVSYEEDHTICNRCQSILEES